jgi:hypothetical protein
VLFIGGGHGKVVLMGMHTLHETIFNAFAIENHEFSKTN